MSSDSESQGSTAEKPDFFGYDDVLFKEEHLLPYLRLTYPQAVIVPSYVFLESTLVEKLATSDFCFFPTNGSPDELIIALDIASGKLQFGIYKKEAASSDKDVVRVFGRNISGRKMASIVSKLVDQLIASRKSCFVGNAPRDDGVVYQGKWEVFYALRHLEEPARCVRKTRAARKNVSTDEDIWVPLLRKHVRCVLEKNREDVQAIMSKYEAGKGAVMRMLADAENEKDRNVVVETPPQPLPRPNIRLYESDSWDDDEPVTPLLQTEEPPTPDTQVSTPDPETQVPVPATEIQVPVPATEIQVPTVKIEPQDSTIETQVSSVETPAPVSVSISPLKPMGQGTNANEEFFDADVDVEAESENEECEFVHHEEEVWEVSLSVQCSKPKPVQTVVCETLSSTPNEEGHAQNQEQESPKNVEETPDPEAQAPLPPAPVLSEVATSLNNEETSNDESVKLKQKVSPVKLPDQELRLGRKRKHTEQLDEETAPIKETDSKQAEEATAPPRPAKRRRRNDSLVQYLQANLEKFSDANDSQDDSTVRSYDVFSSHWARKLKLIRRIVLDEKSLPESKPQRKLNAFLQLGLVQKFDYLQIRNSIFGRGVFTTKDLKADRYIVDYPSRAMSTAEFEHMRDTVRDKKKRKKIHNRMHFTNSEKSIDYVFCALDVNDQKKVPTWNGRKVRFFGHMLNHSLKHANVKPVVKHRVNEEGKRVAVVIFRSLRDIKEGEELLWDYTADSICPHLQEKAWIQWCPCGKCEGKCWCDVCEGKELHLAVVY